MLYGALPGTETLKLSVPHQNPGGASPAGSRSVALAVPALVSTSARPAARASQVRFIVPPVDSCSPSMRPCATVTFWGHLTVPWLKGAGRDARIRCHSFHSAPDCVSPDPL